MWRMKLLFLGHIVQFTASTENIRSCLQCLWHHLVILKDETLVTSIFCLCRRVWSWLIPLLLMESAMLPVSVRASADVRVSSSPDFFQLFVAAPHTVPWLAELGELCLCSSFWMLHLHLFSCRQNLKRLFKMNQIKMLGWRWWDLSWAQEVSDAWTIKCTSVGWHRQLVPLCMGGFFCLLHFVNFDILISGLPTRWDANFSCSLFLLCWKRISKFPRNGKRAVRWTKRGHRLLQPLGENNHTRS